MNGSGKYDTRRKEAAEGHELGVAGQVICAEIKAVRTASTVRCRRDSDLNMVEGLLVVENGKYEIHGVDTCANLNGRSHGCYMGPSTQTRIHFYDGFLSL